MAPLGPLDTIGLPWIRMYILPSKWVFGHSKKYVLYIRSQKLLNDVSSSKKKQSKLFLKLPGSNIYKSHPALSPLKKQTWIISVPNKTNTLKQLASFRLIRFKAICIYVYVCMYICKYLSLHLPFACPLETDSGWKHWTV